MNEERRNQGAPSDIHLHSQPAGTDVVGDSEFIQALHQEIGKVRFLALRGDWPLDDESGGVVWMNIEVVHRPAATFLRIGTSCD